MLAVSSFGLKNHSVFIKKMKKQILKIYISIAVLFSLAMPFAALAFSLGIYGATDITDSSAVLKGSYAIDKEDKELSTFWQYNTFDFKNANDGINWDTGNRVSGTYTTTLTGLAPNTKYYYNFCFVRAERHCTDNLSFTTKPPVTAPTSVTSGVADIRGKQATLNGTWTSNGSSTTTWFEFGTSSNLGNLTSTQNQGGSGSASRIVGNLKLDTTYYFRFVAKNKAGTAYSSIQSFKTLPTDPVVLGNGYIPTTTIDTLGAINITDSSATLQGIGKADVKEDTTAYFRYATLDIPPVFCNDIYGSEMVSTPDINLGTDTTSTPPKIFSQNIGCSAYDPSDASCLTPDTQYYYCALASSRSGISYAQHVYFFKTKPCATCTSITTKPATNIKKIEATLNGSYNTTDAIKTWFEYAKTFAAVSNGSGTVFGIENHSANSFGYISKNISGLQPNTTYRYRAVAEKSNGQLVYDNSTIQTFKTKPSSDTTPCPSGGPPYNPNIVSLISNNVTERLANPISAPISPIFGPIIGIPVGPIHFGGSPLPINSSTSSTNPCLPKMSTSMASNITENSADLNGTWNGSSLPTSTWFEWGPSQTLGTSTLHVPQGSGSGWITESISGLINGVTYYFRAAGQNSQGTTRGSILSFVAGGGNIPVGPYGPNTPTGPSGPGQVVPGTNIPVDAVVRFHEGVEDVFIRQIIGIPEIAKAYGYQSDMDLTQFANDLAHKLAILFGYYENGKEIRVLPPDIAAYELKLGSDGLLVVNEYYAGKLISSRVINETLKSPAGYEYNYINI